MRFAPNWAHVEWVKCIVRDEKLGMVIKFDRLLLWREQDEVVRLRVCTSNVHSLAVRHGGSLVLSTQ
jgi:hypothetical protein